VSGAHRTGDDGQPLPPTTVRHHVVATAGHVDHGKSALVRALTGMEPDRYAEEKRRGMTIDLGFVWTTLDPPARVTGGRWRPRSHLATEASVAFVDVPGHERFVSTMLAGVGPVPVVLLVVAADEGWMPQSAEHVDALDALGVLRGVVAISRSDLADPGPARASVQRHLATTSLAGLPIVSVSSVTGAGLDELRAQLSLVLDGLDEPDAAADVRLWVDRSFTVAGAGTVVTGTLPAGTLRVGDEFDGYITGVAAFGLYVELIEHFVEGMVHVSTMADDYYRFVERAHILRGEHTGRVYRLGDRVRVQVIKVDMERRQVDLGLVEILDKVRASERHRGPRRSKAEPKSERHLKAAGGTRKPRPGRREREKRRR
jgi:selenocysteine-specific elongation factor